MEKTEDFTAELNNIIRDTIKNHKRIIFNGNNYSQEWIEEAKRRGLLNLKNTLEALPEFKKPKNLELFKRHNIFTEQEISSRQEILYANYCKTIHIEALTMLDMVKKGIVPAVISFPKELSELILNKKSLNMPYKTPLKESLG